MTIGRTFLVVVATRDWPLNQMDVTSVDLTEVVDMVHPTGLSIPLGHIYHLRRALYGVKQAPRSWFERFRTAILKAEFIERHSDHALFTRTSGQGYGILLLYVDDMIITGDDHATITTLQQHLNSQNEMKDMGHFATFLGWRFPDPNMAYLPPNKNTSLTSLLLQLSLIPGQLILQSETPLNRWLTSSSCLPLSMTRWDAGLSH